MLQNFSKSRWWIYLWLKSEIFLISVIFFNIIISASSGYLTPKLISGFYEALTDDQKYYHQLSLLGFLFVFEYMNRFVFTLVTHKYIQILITYTRRRCFSSWLNAPLKRKNGKQDDYPLGEVLARLMNDTDAVREVVSSGSFAIFIDLIFILSCLVSFLQLNSTMGITLFLAEVIACLLLIRGSRAMGVIFMDVRRITGLMARVVTDLTNGLRELFFSPNEKYASKRGEKIFEDFLSKQLHANIWDAGYYSAAESLYPILIALVMIVIPYSQIVEVAILAALLDLIQKSITPIKDVASKIAVLARAKTGIERIHQFNESFSTNTSIVENDKVQKVNLMSFDLSLFQYDEGFRLEDIKFELKRGEVLGILGESGCGKSTLLKLLSGQYNTFNGSIQVDDKNFSGSKENELKQFCNYVSLISQDSHVFSESLKFNLTLGDDEGFDEFWRLATNSISYLTKWNFSPSDLVNPKTLSMGQKQLLSGLRALFLKKPIILMDELSSGLDSELELALRDLIKLFQSQTITIIVTHRLETILNSNKIMLMENGKNLALGTHDSMLNINQYREFLDHL